MKKVLVNITSFIGCQDAEHYYAKFVVVDDIDYITEYLFVDSGTVILPSGAEDLTFNPTEEYATKLALKDNNFAEDLDDTIDGYMKYGTSRFMYLHDIVSELRKRYPTYDIICVLNNESTEFEDRYMKEEYLMLYEKCKDKNAIFDEMMKDRTDSEKEYYSRCADWYKRNILFAEVNRNHRYLELGELISKQLKSNQDDKSGVDKD